MSIARRDRAASLVAVAGLMLATGAFVPLLRPAAEGLESDGDPLLRSIWLLVYALVAAGTVHLLRRGVRVAVPDRAMLGLLALSATSVLWSIDPNLSVRRVVALLGSALFAVHAVSALGTRRLLQLVAGVCAVGVVASIGLHLAGVDVVDPLHAPALRGVFVHKNLLGRYAALGVVAAVGAAGGHLTLRRATLAAAAVAASYALTDSVTPTLAAAAALGVSAAASAWAGPTPRMLLAGSVSMAVGLVLAVGAVLGVGAGDLTGALGRDSSLTGRQLVWEISVEMAEERPLTGYGFGAVWSDGSPVARAVARDAEWEASHAHSSFLDLGLNVGAIGAALLGLSLLLALVRSWSGATRGDARGAWLPVVVFVAVLGLAETVIVPHGMVLVVLVAASAALARPPGGLHSSVGAPARSVDLVVPTW